MKILHTKSVSIHRYSDHAAVKEALQPSDRGGEGFVDVRQFQSLRHVLATLSHQVRQNLCRIDPQEHR